MSSPENIAPPGTRTTPAETRTLGAVYNHGGAKEAARHLGLSVRTIESQLASARSRLDVATTTDAIRIAIRTGLIEP